MMMNTNIWKRSTASVLANMHDTRGCIKLVRRKKGQV
jgi:hypothetical protein